MHQSLFIVVSSNLFTFCGCKQPRAEVVICKRRIFDFGEGSILRNKNMLITLYVQTSTFNKVKKFLCISGHFKPFIEAKKKLICVFRLELEGVSCI